MASGLANLEGRTYGPHPLRVCSEKVAEFVVATRDSSERWQRHAPPGWAAAALFVVAPELFEDPDVVNFAPSIIHGEQRFTWEGPIGIETDLEIRGEVTRARERGNTMFVTFEVGVTCDSARLVGGSATFLMSGTAPVNASHEISEPAPHESAVNDPIVGEEFTPVRRSASRADLVRYAAATRDWNPIHWDHRSAVDAGLSGIVVHGLLQAAWILSAAARLSDRPDPFLEAKFRFRSPLLAGDEATVTGRGAPSINLSLADRDREFASAMINLR